jgi:hypothetical protein
MALERRSPAIGTPMRGFECGAGRRIRTDLTGLETGGTHCAFLQMTSALKNSTAQYCRAVLISTSVQQDVSASFFQTKKNALHPKSPDPIRIS